MFMQPLMARQFQEQAKRLFEIPKRSIFGKACTGSAAHVVFFKKKEKGH